MAIKLELNQDEKDELFGFCLRNDKEVTDIEDFIWDKLSIQSSMAREERSLFVNGFIEGFKLYNSTIEMWLHNFREKKKGEDQDAECS